MPLKELIESIIEEAQREAELRIEEAKKKAHEMEEEAWKKGEAEYGEILENAVRLSLEEKNKRLAIASIQARNALLEEKRKLIDEAFARVRQKMEELGEEEYLELMVRQVVKEASEGGGELILSPQDRKRLGEKLVSRANRMLEEKKKPGRIWLSDETRDISWGFILRSGGVEINNSIDAQLSALREKMEDEVVKILNC